MTGFIRRLFRSRPKEETQQSENPPQRAQKQKRQAFYLDPDSAKTLGNIEYMRTPVTIKKRFPKTADNPDGAEMIEQISSLEKINLSQPKPAPTQSPNGQKPPDTPPQQSTPEQNPSERRRSDSSMDMFRNMARDIRKK